ncbi:hypothetical protein L3V59_36230 [Burkholderia aenigmatica]|uniref:hypothetical protein n=1 Tax=Burkholderia aenigmatica TaxID=2015348 RepID=UPI001F2F4B08|nr:hypothetical protein [Burkholderia aenigmatica]UKD17394.1 hypothetical protein L3V59_36230 [Burkholderia aenigmatica]
MAERRDRVSCSHCGMTMVPRVVFSQGEPAYSICPFCGKMHKDFRVGFDWHFLGYAVALVFRLRWLRRLLMYLGVPAAAATLCIRGARVALVAGLIAWLIKR